MSRTDAAISAGLLCPTCLSADRDRPRLLINNMWLHQATANSNAARPTVCRDRWHDPRRR
jgi:hypothetical protein